MTSNRAAPMHRSRNLTPSVPAATATNTSPKPSFKKRFWAISSSNNFTHMPTPDPLSTSPPRAPSSNKPYVPRHAASDFSRNAQAGTLRLRHRHSVAVMSTHAKEHALEDDATLCNYPVDRRSSSDTKRASVFQQDHRRSSINFHDVRRSSVNVHETKRNSVFFQDTRRGSAVVPETKRNSVAMPAKRPSVTFQSAKRTSVVFPHQQQQSKRGSIMIQVPMQRSSRHFALPSENNDDYSQFLAQAERRADMQKKRASQHVSVNVLPVPATSPKERRRSSVFVQRIAQYVRPSR